MSPRRSVFAADSPEFMTPASDRQSCEAYRSLIKKGKLPIRIYAMIGGAGPLWESYLKKGPEIGERLTVRSIKLMSDGAMGSRGAAFWQPYSDDPKNSGLLMLTKERIAEIARQAVEHGFQVNTHAIGDRANRTVLDAYAEVLKGKNDKRFRIEHAQIVTPHDVRCSRRIRSSRRFSRHTRPATCDGLNPTGSGSNGRRMAREDFPQRRCCDHQRFGFPGGRAGPASRILCGGHPPGRCRQSVRRIPSERKANPRRSATELDSRRRIRRVRGERQGHARARETG